MENLLNRVEQVPGGTDLRRKICMVTYLPSVELLPPMYNGGMSLAQAGFKVEAICYTRVPTETRTQNITDGFTTIYLFSRSLKYFHGLYGLSPKNMLLAAVQYILSYLEFNVKAFGSALRSKADLYEAHDLPALLPTFLAAFVRSKPVTYHAHELYAEMHEKVRFASWWKMLDRLLVPHVALVVTPEENRSRIMFEEYKAKEMPMTLRNCPPYSPPIHSVKIREILANRGFHPKKIVLYQGLFDNSRCMKEMIDAAAFFDEGIVLVLMGNGFNEWQSPENIVGDSNHVIVLPKASYAELSLYTASADIGILFYRNNCRNNYYCAPNKLYEYMMMGLPVVTNDYPGIADLVAGEEIGVCVDSRDTRRIADAVNKLAGSPRLYKTMRQNCLRLSKLRLNWEEESKKLQHRYMEILQLSENANDARNSGRLSRAH